LGIHTLPETMLLLAALAALLPLTMPADDPPAGPEARVAIVIHGGAGVIVREQMTEEMEAAYRAELENALRAGHAVLAAGGSALDAVVAAVTPLEDSELFNAGRGAVLTNEGRAELDASIMHGASRDAGAVAGVTTIKNPILAARLVMEQSPHVMMVGAGAEQFVAPHGLEMVENDYFLTDRRREALERVQEREASQTGALVPPDPEAWQMSGTVGAVALDASGHIAAATSTGGMTNKRFGRVGDSPIIGAGTYADDATCGVSATGHGEYFIRLAVAHSICARMRFLGESVEEAAHAVIHEDLAALGGTGGVIALDSQGAITMPFNTPGMFRGYVDVDGNLVVQIYGD
jgi:L-asparaginase / beta-aspartyl-peptidase